MTPTDEVRIVVALTTQEIRRLGCYMPILVIGHEGGSLALQVNNDETPEEALSQRPASRVNTSMA